MNYSHEYRNTKINSMSKHLLFFLGIISITSCSCSTKGTGEKAGPELLKKVSVYSNDSVVAATYFSTDTNWTELAKALWQEKAKLVTGKDSATIYYLFVFNDLDYTPDISRDYDRAWNQDFMHYRSCCIDNGFGFPRFCYGIRYDDGRVGDWAKGYELNADGTLPKEK